jgi:hypothetical protein
MSDLLNTKAVDDLVTAIRELKEKRGATDQQTKPTGNGAVVLDSVVEYINNQITNPYNGDRLREISNDGLTKLRDDLKLRAEMGKAKYGTYLRVDNGRNASLDLYQELCDAIMYSKQAGLEGKPGMSGAYFALLVRLASMLSTEV